MSIGEAYNMFAIILCVSVIGGLIAVARKGNKRK